MGEAELVDSAPRLDLANLLRHTFTLTHIGRNMDLRF